VKKRVLVTGGAGFVGSTLAHRLVRNGDDVVIIDDLSNGKRSNLPEGARFIQGDLANDSVLAQLCTDRFDQIFHIAAQASNAISFRDPVRDLLSNQVATLKLLEFARKTNSMRVLFTSSMSAYGDASEFPTLESTPLTARSPYGVHKAASEHYLRIYAEEYGLKWTVFRLYTTYGSGQNLDNLDQGLLSIYLAYLVRKVPIVVKGSLERKRDIVHVSDVVEAIQLAADNPKTFGQCYNLCSGVSLSIRELLSEMFKQMGEDPGYPIEVQPGTPGDPPVTHGSYEKAERDFGYSPKVSPYDGIRMTVEALRKNHG